MRALQALRSENRPIIGVPTLFEGTNFRSMRCFGPVHYDYLALRMVAILHQNRVITSGTLSSERRISR